MDAKPEFAELFRTLSRHGVLYVVVGGVAANLQGAGFFTEDVDVLAAIDVPNVERLVGALAELDARYLDFAGRVLRPDAERLLGNRLNLLQTRLGRLDVLKKMGRDRDYSALAPRASPMELGDLRLLVASLEDLIEAKEVANRTKDLQHLLVLRELARTKGATGEKQAKAGKGDPTAGGGPA